MPPKLTDAESAEDKKHRRKHKNSKLGCVQCKERRMKCNEELPECRNCRIRQVKIPCSYLSFTEDEKKDFMVKKAANASNKLNRRSALPSPNSTSPSVWDSDSPCAVSNKKVELKLVKHTVLQTFESQKIKFIDETLSSFHGRLFYNKMLNNSFFNFKESFACHLSLASFWLHLQLKKKYEFTDKEHRLADILNLAMKHKSETINYLRDSIISLIKAQSEEQSDMAIKYYLQTTIPTICLQASDILTKSSLKTYYFDGSMHALKEVYSNTADNSPMAKFIAQSTLHTQRCLFMPNYSIDVLQEILQVLNEMENIINDTNDDLLINHYDKLIEFFEAELNESTLKAIYDPKFVTAFPANKIYSIYYRFNQIVPSEIFTIDSSNSPVHKVFYSYLYMIGRVLDNIFPESRYLCQFRFIGPTCLYPYTRNDLYTGLSNELIYFANYSSRLLTFFTRRTDLFTKYMKIMTPFPDDLDANRFHSRRIKVDEQYVSNFKSTCLQSCHYPQVKSHTYDENSPSSNSSFSRNFNGFFNLDFEFNKNLILEQHSDKGEPTPDLFDVCDTGLLKNDYDPLKEDLTDLGGEEPDIISLRQYIDDRAKLMKEFSK